MVLLWCSKKQLVIFDNNQVIYRQDGNQKFYKTQLNTHQKLDLPSGSCKNNKTQHQHQHQLDLPQQHLVSNGGQVELPASDAHLIGASSSSSTPVVVERLRDLDGSQVNQIDEFELVELGQLGAGLGRRRLAFSWDREPFWTLGQMAPLHLGRRLTDINKGSLLESVRSTGSGTETQDASQRCSFIEVDDSVREEDLEQMEDMFEASARLAANEEAKSAPEVLLDLELKLNGCKIGCCEQPNDSCKTDESSVKELSSATRAEQVNETIRLLGDAKDRKQRPKLSLGRLLRATKSSGSQTVSPIEKLDDNPEKTASFSRWLWHRKRINIANQLECSSHTGSDSLSQLVPSSGVTTTTAATTSSSVVALANPTGSRTVHTAMISYHHVEGRHYALALKQALESQQISCYLDVDEIRHGQDWQDSLNQAILGCQLFIALITPSYGSTLWTARESKLADLLNKCIIPVNFGQPWPPPALAIQFATVQYVSWLSVGHPDHNSISSSTSWPRDQVHRVATLIKQSLQPLPADLDSAQVIVTSQLASSSSHLPSEDSGYGSPDSIPRLLRYGMHLDRPEVSSPLSHLSTCSPVSSSSSSSNAWSSSSASSINSSPLTSQLHELEIDGFTCVTARPLASWAPDKLTEAANQSLKFEEEPEVAPLDKPARQIHKRRSSSIKFQARKVFSKVRRRLASQPTNGVGAHLAKVDPAVAQLHPEEATEPPPQKDLAQPQPQPQQVQQQQQ